MSDAPTEHEGDGRVAAAISSLTEQMLGEYTGRDPTAARTHIDRDLVTVVLDDALTKGERSLVRDGEQRRVLETREAYQRTMRDDLVGGVEKLIGREVVAFMSSNHIDPDVSVEIFILAPDGAPEPKVVTA